MYSKIWLAITIMPVLMGMESRVVLPDAQTAVLSELTACHDFLENKSIADWQQKEQALEKSPWRRRLTIGATALSLLSAGAPTLQTLLGHDTRDTPQPPTPWWQSNVAIGSGVGLLTAIFGVTFYYQWSEVTQELLKQQNRDLAEDCKEQIAALTTVVEQLANHIEELQLSQVHDEQFNQQLLAKVTGIEEQFEQFRTIQTDVLTDTKTNLTEISQEAKAIRERTDRLSTRVDASQQLLAKILARIKSFVHTKKES